MTQRQVWNNIADEWYEFKINPSEKVLDFLKGKKGKILDLGSGAGRHLKKIPNGKMYLIDFSKNMINLAKQRAKEKKIDAEFFVSEATKLPFKSNFFDSAIAIAVFHCIKPKSQEKSIKELYRVMKPRAKALIAVWNKDSKRFRNVNSKERFVKWRSLGERYYYLFEPKEIYNLFKKAGFRIFKRYSPERNIIFIVQK